MLISRCFVLKAIWGRRKNAERFAKECAIVTHYRLKKLTLDKKIQLMDPEAKNWKKNLVVRPPVKQLSEHFIKTGFKATRIYPFSLINGC